MTTKTKASEEFAAGKHNIGYVTSSFKSHFGDMEVETGSVLQSHKLTRSMNDDAIIKEFNIQECSLGDVIATLDAATEDMKDGRWNLFYIKGSSRVVSVGWDSRDRGWCVHDWNRGGSEWDEGLRVFSHATDTGSSNSVSRPSILETNKTVLQQFADFIGSDRKAEYEVAVSDKSFVVIKKQ